MPGYFNFDKLISSSLIKVTYVIGMLCITAGGLAVIGVSVYNYTAAPPALEQVVMTATIYQVVVALAALTLGDLLWRVVCETWILLFSMHEQLASIKRELINRP